MVRSCRWQECNGPPAPVKIEFTGNRADLPDHLNVAGRRSSLVGVGIHEADLVQAARLEISKRLRHDFIF